MLAKFLLTKIISNYFSKLIQVEMLYPGSVVPLAMFLLFPNFVLNFSPTFSNFFQAFSTFFNFFQLFFPTFFSNFFQKNYFNFPQVFQTFSHVFFNWTWFAILAMFLCPQGPLGTPSLVLLPMIVPTFHFWASRSLSDSVSLTLSSIMVTLSLVASAFHFGGGRLPLQANKLTELKNWRGKKI